MYTGRRKERAKISAVSADIEGKAFVLAAGTFQKHNRPRRALEKPLFLLVCAAMRKDFLQAFEHNRKRFFFPAFHRAQPRDRPRKIRRAEQLITADTLQRENTAAL